LISLMRTFSLYAGCVRCAGKKSLGPNGRRSAR
jgi:hypothetical protein